MTEDSSQNENKNTSKYDELIQLIKSKHYTIAKEYIPKLCYALREENPNLTNEDINERIKKDLVDIWSRTTIYTSLPEEFKDEDKGKRISEGMKQKSSQTTEKSTTAPELIKPVISLTANGKPANHDEEMKQIYHSPERNGNNNTNGINTAETILRWMDLARDKDLEIGRLKEQLKEQKEQIQELVKSVNAVTEAKKANQKPIPATETLEYKALISQNNILQERIQELEQIVKKSIAENPAVGFQSATNMVGQQQRNSNEIATKTNDIEFPSNLLGKFFVASRNVKSHMKLNINENKVTGWTVE